MGKKITQFNKNKESFIFGKNKKALKVIEN